jgi:1-phosphatidylinositol-4-phosphate 5-kinase
MIKTQTTEENKFMKRILPHYYRYVSENPHTFLVRIYGMHRVKMYHLQRKVHFVIMSSVFDTPEPINRIYDLKGSLVGRKASARDREVGGVLKDNDLMDDCIKLKLGSKRQMFLDQLEKDANFLAKLNIMDYSLLVGIHRIRASIYISLLYLFCSELVCGTGRHSLPVIARRAPRGPRAGEGGPSGERGSR